MAAIMIFVRSMYSVAEPQAGFGGKLANDEVLSVICERPMVIIASGALTAFHPVFCFVREWRASGKSRDRRKAENIKANKKAGRISLQHLDSSLPSNTRMMNFQHLGRACGDSKSMQRLTLAVLLMLLIITPISLSSLLIPPVVMSLVIINLLVLIAESVARCKS
ncbi:hypothetical protein EPUS_01885 [Endocarpon pusillum Z07020]|uniref:Uncharacterized protein n=1 Tax=Endocarpon pusillum (strain Z07020 / HMAS-L-300199) TaxID=1263415 RepID=U1HHB6_ENDPU|nr:uncharacterized protein EPUS_01885 [Endocarpon pusillum Z07020]ERF69555.1 hypothetical protein EPUS_01885 [Endocarpon pusillum Z07020]